VNSVLEGGGHGTVEGRAQEYVRTVLATPAMEEWTAKANKEPWTEPQYD
jgi:hypothetical protein